MKQNIPAAALEFPHAAPPAPGNLIEIAPGVRWFRLPLPYRLDHVNIYLIEDADGWTVLDTGLGTDACRTAWESILSGPLAGQRLTSMIVTHFHPDHVGLAGWLAERLTCSFRCHAPNISTLSMPRLNSTIRSLTPIRPMRARNSPTRYAMGTTPNATRSATSSPRSARGRKELANSVAAKQRGSLRR